MKVGNKIGQSIAGSEAAKTNKADGAKRTGEKSLLEGLGTSKGGDTSKVSVSDRAQSMQKAKDIASKSGVDEAKVARLQKMIDEGNYKVDAKAVADRLVDEQLAMSEVLE